MDRRGPWLLSVVQASRGDVSQRSLELCGVGKAATFEPLINGPHIGSAVSNMIERFDHVVAFSAVELAQDPDTEGGIILWHVWVVRKDFLLVY